MGFSTPAAKTYDQGLHAVGLRSYWQPEETGFIPTISAGFDYGWSDADDVGSAEEVIGWLVGLSWNDAFIEGNRLGVGFGSYSSYAQEVKGMSSDDESNFAIEAYYDFQVSDNIRVTPAVFYVDNAFGKASVSDDAANKLGALVQTTFKF